METDAQNQAISPTLGNSITTTSASAMSDPVIDYRSGSKDPAGRTAYSGDPITRPLRERLRSNRQSEVGAIVSLIVWLRRSLQTSINSSLLDEEVTAIVAFQVNSVRPKQHAKVKTEQGASTPSGTSFTKNIANPGNLRRELRIRTSNE